MAIIFKAQFQNGKWWWRRRYFALGPSITGKQWLYKQRTNEAVVNGGAESFSAYLCFSPTLRHNFHQHIKQPRNKQVLRWNGGICRRASAAWTGNSKPANMFLSWWPAGNSRQVHASWLPFSISGKADTHSFPVMSGRLTKPFLSWQQFYKQDSVMNALDYMVTWAFALVTKSTWKNHEIQYIHSPFRHSRGKNTLFASVSESNPPGLGPWNQKDWSLNLDFPTHQKCILFSLIFCTRLSELRSDSRDPMALKDKIFTVWPFTGNVCWPLL